MDPRQPAPPAGWAKEPAGSLRKGEAACACLLLGALLPAPALGAGLEGPRERVRVMAVQVPVQVTVKGDPVRGLTREDFLLLDRGKPREITGFDVLDLDLYGPQGPNEWGDELPIALRRHFLLLFDMSFSRPASIARARAAVMEWLDQGLHPSDIVAVATYSATRGFQALLNFTTDRRQVDLAIGTLGLPQLVRRRQDPLGLELADPRQADADTPLLPGRDPGPIGPGDPIFLEGLQDLYYGVYDPLMRTSERRDVNDLADSFSKMARTLRAVQGRKYVIYLSEGFDSSLVFASHDPEELRELNEQVVQGQLWRVDSTKRFGSVPTQSLLDQMLQEFRKADCVIHAVDLRSAFEPQEARTLPGSGDALGFIAHGTGGEVYRGFHDLTEALGRILRASSVTYLLTFAPPDIEADGAFHKVRVKLQREIKGAQVSHRPGYFAPQPIAAQSEDERRYVVAAMLLDGRDGGELGTEVLAVPFGGGAGKAYVPVLIELDGRDLLAWNAGQELAVELYAYALDPQGAIADYFTQRVQLRLQELRPLLERSGLKFYGDVELPPGRYTLRVLALVAGSGAAARRTVRLEVPESPAVRVLAALVPEPRGKWVLARENADEAETRARFPFVAAGMPYLPAARPELASGARARVYIVVAGADPARAPTVNARLVGEGRVLEDVLWVEGSPTRDPAGNVLLTASLALEDVPPGEYTLELVSSGPPPPGESPPPTALHVRVVPPEGS